MPGWPRSGILSAQFLQSPTDGSVKRTTTKDRKDTTRAPSTATPNAPRASLSVQTIQDHKSVIQPLRLSLSGEAARIMISSSASPQSPHGQGRNSRRVMRSSSAFVKNEEGEKEGKYLSLNSPPRTSSKLPQSHLHPSQEEQTTPAHAFQTKLYGGSEPRGLHSPNRSSDNINHRHLKVRRPPTAPPTPSASSFSTYSTPSLQHQHSLPSNASSPLRISEQQLDNSSKPTRPPRSSVRIPHSYVKTPRPSTASGLLEGRFSRQMTQPNASSNQPSKPVIHVRPCCCI